MENIKKSDQQAEDESTANEVPRDWDISESLPGTPEPVPPDVECLQLSCLQDDSSDESLSETFRTCRTSAASDTPETSSTSVTPGTSAYATPTTPEICTTEKLENPVTPRKSKTHVSPKTSGPTTSPEISAKSSLRGMPRTRASGSRSTTLVSPRLPEICGTPVTPRRSKSLILPGMLTRARKPQTFSGMTGTAVPTNTILLTRAPGTPVASRIPILRRSPRTHAAARTLKPYQSPRMTEESASANSSESFLHRKMTETLTSVRTSETFPFLRMPGIPVVSKTSPSRGRGMTEEPARARSYENLNYPRVGTTETLSLPPVASTFSEATRAPSNRTCKTLLHARTSRASQTFLSSRMTEDAQNPRTSEEFLLPRITGMPRASSEPPRTSRQFVLLRRSETPVTVESSGTLLYSTTSETSETNRFPVMSGIPGISRTPETFQSRRIPEIFQITRMFPTPVTGRTSVPFLFPTMPGALPTFRTPVVYGLPSNTPIHYIAPGTHRPLFKFSTPINYLAPGTYRTPFRCSRPINYLAPGTYIVPLSCRGPVTYRTPIIYRPPFIYRMPILVPPATARLPAIYESLPPPVLPSTPITSPAAERSVAPRTQPERHRCVRGPPGAKFIFMNKEIKNIPPCDCFDPDDQEKPDEPNK